QLCHRADPGSDHGRPQAESRLYRRPDLSGDDLDRPDPGGAHQGGDHTDQRGQIRAQYKIAARLSPTPTARPHGEELFALLFHTSNSQSTSSLREALATKQSGLRVWSWIASLRKEKKRPPRRRPFDLVVVFSRSARVWTHKLGSRDVQMRERPRRGS